MPSIPSSWPWWTVELERYASRQGRWRARRGRLRVPHRRAARWRAALIYAPWGWRPRGSPKRAKGAA